MCNYVILLCLAANNILLMHERNLTLFSFLRSLFRENGSFPQIFIKKTNLVTE